MPARLFSYRDATLNRLLIFAEHFFQRYQAPSRVFGADTRPWWRTLFFTFRMFSLVLTIRGQSDGLDNFIDPNRQIIWHHLLIVAKPTPPFKSQKILVSASPSRYFESTMSCTSLLFIV